MIGLGVAVAGVLGVGVTVVTVAGVLGVGVAVVAVAGVLGVGVAVVAVAGVLGVGVAVVAVAAAGAGSFRTPARVDRRPSWPTRLGAVRAAVGAVGVRRAARRTKRSVARELPSILDLLAGALDGGLTTPQALDEIAARHPGHLATALGDVAETYRRGESLVVALDELVARHGTSTASLAELLAAPDRHGAAIGASLRELAGERRAELRRDVETAARRLPVRLLFPLVCCVLPAFVVIAVVPVVVDALSSLTA